MEERRFDDLTKRLAGKPSRRSVLKGMAAGLAGAFASTIGVGAAPGRNNNCAHFCNAIFPPGPAHDQCVSDAAHLGGLCFACNGNPANVCAGPNGPYCPDFTSDVNNCAGCGNVCPSDECNLPACNGGICGLTPTNEGQPCSNGTGTCTAGVCAPNTNPNPTCAGATCDTFIPGCAANTDCVCTTTAEGGGFCIPGSTNCGGLAACPNGSSDCGPDALCVVNTCCVTPVCVPISLTCPPEATGAARPQTATSGPTIASR